MPRAWGERLLDRISPVFGREEQLKRLEDALEDASDPNQPKQIVLLYGHSGLSKCKLVEMAFGVLDQPQMGGHHRLSSDNPSNGKCSSGERRSGITQSTSASSGGINHPPQQQHYPSRRQAPCPCWYGFGKFTKEQEDKPFAELSRSIAEIVTRQLIPECQRESGAADTATVESTASGNSSDTKLTSSPQLYDIKKLLRERLLVSEVDALIKFCPEVEQLHLFSARERAAEQTKRAAKAAKNSAMVLSDLVGRGLAGVAPSYFSAPSAGLISSINSDKSRASTNGHVAPRGSPFNKLERLKYVVKVFFRTLSEVRPLVWVLDDLQYATKDGLSSLSFIESLLDDSKLKRFLFCGVVRDDEKTMKETKALRQWLDSLPSVLELRMEHMDEKNVEAMLWNLLRVEGDDLEQLASLIYQRTHGNDYFVFEMINYLQQEGVITFSTQTYQWEFDIDEVKRKTMVSENVLSFVGRRLQQLPMPVQRYLKLAAFLGYRFDEDLLARIARANFVQSHNDMKENEAEIHELLQMAVDEGFIERLSYPNVIRYKFVHVEIQTECERLIKEKGGAMSAEKLHWNIGAALWRGWRRLESYGNIENRVLFPCVKELNAGRRAYKPRKATFYQLARLNHEAAKRSFELHAYFPAASYLQTAINLMGRCAWNDNYHLCLELHTFLAQMYLASGQLNRIPKIVRVVGEHVESFQDRLPVDLVELARCKMLGDIDMHIQKSISLLNLLGVSLSGDYFWFQTERKKRRVKGTLISLSDEEIQARTQASGSTDSTTIEQIEQELIHTLVFSVESKVYLEKEYPNLETAVAIKMIESFLNEQNGPNSGALCLTLAACLFCETDNDQKFFRKLLKWLSFSKDQADLAFSIRLAELALKVPSTENELQTMAVIALVRHWRYPLPNCAELMLKSYNVGMQSGDLRTAANAALGYIQMYLFSGLPLPFLSKDVDKILTVMIDYSQKYDAMRLLPAYQLILNLTGDSYNVLDLSSGAAIDRAAAIGWVPLWESNLDAELMLYTHCHEFNLATIVFEKIEASNMGIVRFHAAWHTRVFNLALVAIHNARSTWVKSRKWKRKARKYVSMIQRWVDECQAINLGHKLKLLEAEMLTLRRPHPSDEILMPAYDDAIIRSARSGFLQDAARAAALASKAVRNKFEKHQYARRSQEFYASWGAYGIISHLRKKNRIFRESCEEQLSRSSPSGQGVQGRQRFLDEDGILQAHRSVTAAEDKVQKDLASQKRSSVFPFNKDPV